MKIFDGKKEAEKILKELKKKIKKGKIKPKLAVILVGDNPASKLYIKIKKRVGKRVGVLVSEYRFKGKVKEEEVIQKIRSLNENKETNGIIVQLPLPKGLNTAKIIETIDPKKDVDGFHELNLQLLKKGKPYFFPVLPSAILLALKNSSKNLKKQKTVALVNSNFFGKSLQNFLKIKGIKINYLLRKKTAVSRLKSADIIITVCGYPKLIKGGNLKKGIILIDGGTTYSKKKLAGDVDRKSVEGKASFLTPVPGGIGPITVALLLRNVYLAKKQYGKFR